MKIPVRLILEIVIGAALLIGGYLFGDSSADNACDAGKAKQQDKAVQVKEKKVEAGQVVAQKHEEKKIKRETTFQSIEKRGAKNEENNPQYRSCGLDADGLRIWNDANAGIESEAAGIANGATSRSAASGSGRPGLAEQEPSPGGEALPPAGGSLPVAGGMDQSDGQH